MDEDLKSTIEEAKSDFKNYLINIKKSWRKILSSIFSLILYTSIIYSNELFGLDFREYINRIPSEYFTIFLSVILVLSIFQPFFKKRKIDDNNILNLSSQNDYARLDSGIGISTLFFTGFLIYIYFFGLPDTNPLLIASIMLFLTIHGGKVKKTAFFKKKGSFLFYENEKEKRRFVLFDIELIVIFKNQIVLNYQNKEHLIAFLELKEKDLDDIIYWFKKQLPHSVVIKK